MSSSAGNGFDNQTVDQLKYWDKPGDITDVPEPRLFYGNGVNANGELHWLNLTKSYNHNSNDDDLIFVQENNEIKCYTIEGELKD